MIARLLSALLCACLVQGCGPKEDVASEIKRWESEGWHFVETVGTNRDDAVYVAHLSSDTASSIKATSHTNDGNKDSKIYPQDSRLYLVVRMGHEAHGSFSLVFSKLKP